MSRHISKKYKRAIIGRTWVAERRVTRAVRFSKIVRKHQIETVVPYLVMSCGHALKAKNYSGQHQTFGYCKVCYDKRRQLIEKARQEIEDALGRSLDESELEMCLKRRGI